METLKEKLNSDGWLLCEDGFKIITEEGKIMDKSTVEKKALNMDIRELGGCAFPAEITKGKYESISGNIIVQIQKIRNISAPKSNEESQGAPRLLKLILSDGSQSCTALEISPLPFISLNTPPGTKLRLKGEITVTSGMLHLNTGNVELLGGIVSTLVEKWTMNRNLAKHTRGRVGMEGGPPPWVPFGEKVSNASNLTDKNFKSLDDGGKENKEDNEFEAQRRDAIAEAGKGCTRKVFGGGTKPLLDKNVQAIMDKGFSLQVAENALRQNRNNVDRALRCLQRKTGKGGDDKEKNEKEGGRGGRRKNEEETGPKPSGRVVLFQFLEDKIPFPDKDKNKEKEWEPTHNKVNNDGSSSYRQKWNNQPAQERNRGRDKVTFSSSSTEKKSRDDRGGNSRWQSNNQNQKPPRFQNQYRKNEQASTEHFEQFGSRDDGNAMSNMNSDNYFSTKSCVNNIQQFNGFRNSFKLDTFGYGQSPADYRNQNSSFFKPPGMPDIPEFPYKDNSAFMPILSSQNSGNRNNNSLNKTDKYRWKVGDKCMAKYWEDNMYYNAEVTGISKKTCVVRFLHYGNFEEVLQDDCIPVAEDMSGNIHDNESNTHFNSANKNNLSGAVDFRRGPRSFSKQEGSNASMAGRRTAQRYSMPVYLPPPGRTQSNNK
ncbi:tudor domain-containing protein 3-like isoform X2 [Rhodnius prolixus]|uniref:tudor domain-containing protein 3-like isoform X2 n=1 Tax=Rhodnius prolixus TaxID=13249 RepID=UPI003D188C0E